MRSQQGMKGQAMPRRVLLVDDESALLNCMTYYLEDAGYQVLTATTCVAALEMLELYRPHAIVCDLHMSEPDGLLLCRRVWQHPDWQTIPLILLIAAAEEIEFRRQPDPVQRPGRRCDHPVLLVPGL